MKISRIRLLIPLFLFFGVLFFCSLNVYAAPTAPDSITITTALNGSNVTQAAKGSSITIKAQAHGGSGGDGRRYEYSFSYKAPSGGSYSTLRNFSQTASVDFTLSEAGTYIFRVLGRVADNSGNSQTITADTNFKSVGVSNTSTISSSAINVGESVTINASATGGSQYEYYYSISNDGGSTYAVIQPSSSSAQYVPAASCTYKPSSASNFLLRVIAREKSTGATDQKIFNVTASNAKLLNLCDVSKTEVEITGKNQSISLIFKADKGTAPYKYRCSYTIDGGSKNYCVGDASNFVNVASNKPFALDKTGTYLFTFEVQDSSGSTNISEIKKTVTVSANLVNTTTISSNKVSNRGEVGINLSATGGTGDYEYKVVFKIEGNEKVSRDFKADNTTDSWSIANIIKAYDLGEDYTGGITFITYVRDKNLRIETKKEFDIAITEASAAEVTRQDLNSLVLMVREWEMSLNQSQRDNLNEHQKQYIAARDNAYSAVTSTTVQNYEKYYFDLYEKWTAIKNDALGDEFWMTDEVNNAVAFEGSVLKSVEGWFTSFSGTNVSSSTFNFNIEAFVDQFSQIFVIFASALLVLLFGVNVIKTAIEYQLFTLRGAVTLFARLILAEIWIQLSTKICIMIIKIFNELMASIIVAINTSGLLSLADIKFKPDRSGVWLVGDIIDFFKNLCPFLLVMLLVCIVLIIFLIVYVKLIIRTIEISMLTVISPVFFACSVGEATMPYFKKFISTFLAVCAEIIFMGLVYLAYLWYCQGVSLSGVAVSDLYNFSSTSAATFYTYTAVTVACGVMMIRPPQVLRDLMK